MISDHHIHHSLNDPPDLSVDHFPKKRRLSDIDYHLEEDYHKKRQINKLYSGSTGAKRRRLVGDQEDHGGNEEKKKTSTTTKRRSGDIKVSGKKQKAIMAGPNPPPEMSNALKEKIVKEIGEYSDLRLLLQKSLFRSDVEKNLNRLSMPLGQLESDDFLTDMEKKKLESRKANDSNHLEGVEIDFFEPNLEFKKSKMTLKKWDYDSSSSYMLSEHWYNVVTRNGLKKEDVVQIWFFRKREGNNPCIALVNLSQRNDSSSSSASSTVVDHKNGESDQSIRSDVTA